MRKSPTDLYSAIKDRLWFRIIFAAAVPLLIFSSLFYLYRNGSPLFCPFYKMTGLYCQGCGSGRALYSLVHFRLLESLHNNILFIPLAIMIIWYVIKRYLHIVCGKDMLPFFPIRRGFLMTLIIFMILYTVLRNIKVYPFTLLAPL